MLYFKLLLKAKDQGDTPLETTRFLTVVIKDVNDNRPVFAQSEVKDYGSLVPSVFCSSFSISFWRSVPDSW